MEKLSYLSQPNVTDNSYHSSFFLVKNILNSRYSVTNFAPFTQFRITHIYHGHIGF